MLYAARLNSFTGLYSYNFDLDFYLHFGLKIIETLTGDKFMCII